MPMAAINNRAEKSPGQPPIKGKVTRGHNLVLNPSVLQNAPCSATPKLRKRGGAPQGALHPRGHSPCLYGSEGHDLNFVVVLMTKMPNADIMSTFHSTTSACNSAYTSKATRCWSTTTPTTGSPTDAAASVATSWAWMSASSCCPNSVSPRFGAIVKPKWHHLNGCTIASLCVTNASCIKSPP